MSDTESVRPQIVCLCGSTRFAHELTEISRELTFAGAIVLAPEVFWPSDDLEARHEVTAEQKSVLDRLHRHTIDLADRVVVVNPGGYVGESTTGEIAYARAHGTPVSFTHPE